MPMAPTISPFSMIGKPPPNTTSRGVWVMPCSSGGSSLMKANQAWVGIEYEAAVNALSCAIWIDSFGAPSMRANALRSPLSSATAMHIFSLSSVAFFAAATTAFSAISASMLFLTIVMRFLRRVVLRPLGESFRESVRRTSCRKTMIQSKLSVNVADCTSCEALPGNRGGHRQHFRQGEGLGAIGLPERRSNTQGGARPAGRQRSVFPPAGGGGPVALSDSDAL